MNKSVKKFLVAFSVALGVGVAEGVIEYKLAERRAQKSLNVTKEEWKFYKKLMKEGRIVTGDPSEDDMVIRVEPDSEEERYFSNNAAVSSKPITIRLGAMWGWPYNEYVFDVEEDWLKAKDIMKQYYESLPED